MPNRALNFVVIFALSAVVSGCLINSVRGVHRQSVPERGQALVVLGVGLAAAWPHPAYSISLDEYSLKAQKITGNCFHYNHIEATIPSGESEIRYFAFLVPAGVYVFSAFNAGTSPRPIPRPAAYSAPSGAVVYFGNYVYVGEAGVQLRSDIGAAGSALKNLIPRSLALTQAKAEPSVEHGTAFLCTP